MTTPITLAEIPAKYAQPDPASLAKLPKPTSRDNPKGKCDVCNGWHGLPAIHLDYMGHADITLALIDVDPTWTWEPFAMDEDQGGPKISVQGNRLVMWAYLTVLGKRMLGVGTCEVAKGDPEKELVGDFLRNAAMRYGIATKLWSKADSADPAGSAPGGGYERHKRPTAPQADPKKQPLSLPIDALIARLKAADGAVYDRLQAEADKYDQALDSKSFEADHEWANYVYSLLPKQPA